jgi:hypothetical protein
MKHHEITLEGLQEFISEEEVSFAYSTRENKRLVCTLKGTLKVKVGNKVVWQGMQPFTAVEKYNGITEKYKEDNEPFSYKIG